MFVKQVGIVIRLREKWFEYFEIPFSTRRIYYENIDKQECTGMHIATKALYVLLPFVGNEFK